LSASEELDELLFTFISSKGKPAYGKTFKDLIPASDEIWELRTYQLRIFGWFYRKDDFIAALPLRKPALKNPGAYDDAKKKVIAIRDGLPLDPPKFVGGRIQNVLSGF
jgi:hypothetical protein